MTEDEISFKCHECGAELTARRDRAGEEVECNCGAANTVPGGADLELQEEQTPAVEDVAGAGNREAPGGEELEFRGPSETESGEPEAVGTGAAPGAPGRGPAQETTAQSTGRGIQEEAANLGKEFLDDITERRDVDVIVAAATVALGLIFLIVGATRSSVFTFILLFGLPIALGFVGRAIYAAGTGPRRTRLLVLGGLALVLTLYPVWSISRHASARAAYEGLQRGMEEIERSLEDQLRGMRR